MAQYTFTAFNYVGGPGAVGKPFDVIITDDDDTMDWMGQDTGTGETIEINGTTYDLAGTGTKIISFTTTDGEEVEEEFVYSIIPNYGHILIPLDEDSQFSADCEISHNSGWEDKGVEYQDIPCFASGSLIYTPNGQHPVESLMIGDMVTTMDNGPQKVLWVGTSPIDMVHQIMHPKTRPITFPVGSTGSNQQVAPLSVSSPHRMLLCGADVEMWHGENQAFAPASALIGQNGIHRAAPHPNLTYHHILLPQHEIIFANGVASESFFPGGQALHALGKSARTSLFKAYPNLAADPSLYGKTARLCLTKHEAQALQIAGKYANA